MSFLSSAAYKATTTAEQAPSIALVTGAKSGIGLAIARKIASFPFIEKVLAVSRSISTDDVAAEGPKFVPVAADVATEQGRQLILNQVEKYCGGTQSEDARKMQLRFLIHSAGTIDPIKHVLELQPSELRNVNLVNCEGPLFLTTALHPCMKPLGEANLSGRVLHVSSGAAHGAKLVGWGAYCISKAAFLQSFRVLEHELRDTGVTIGSFKPGIVDTAMQGVIRQSNDTSMPKVKDFIQLKNNCSPTAPTGTAARPPPKGSLDTPENVAFFSEFLLLGTTDTEFANADDPSEWDIRDERNFSKWIPAENLPKEDD